jgi:hypothetical protein
MDNVQNCDSYINIPSSCNFKYFSHYSYFELSWLAERYLHKGSFRLTAHTPHAFRVLGNSWVGMILSKLMQWSEKLYLSSRYA